MHGTLGKELNWCLIFFTFYICIYIVKCKPVNMVKVMQNQYKVQNIVLNMLK